MHPLELTIIQAGNEEEILKKLGINARISTSSWDTYWGKLLNIAFHRDGPDVSQVGAPSTGGVISMNVLRAFTRQEVKSMGGEEVFLPESWRTTKTKKEPYTWAIPFNADIRVLFYWRDLLEKVNIQPEKAFSTPTVFETTLKRLQESGVDFPWAFYAAFPYATLHVASMWVWAGGGEILDGKHFALTDPAPLESLKEFFRLKKYMPRYAYETNSSENLMEAFARQEIAVICAGSNMLNPLQIKFQDQPERLKKLGVALPPGPAYVGGSNFIIWGHCRQEKQAVALVQQLTSKEMQLAFCQEMGYLPTRLDALAEPPYSTEPLYKIMVEALKTGRAFPDLPRWGLVEDRLSSAFLHIWQQLYENPEADSDTILEQTLIPIGKRLNLTLSDFG
ncbi:MAG: hypothetical protein Fur0022_03870 [Anaerolineales bacterium]